MGRSLTAIETRKNRELYLVSVGLNIGELDGWAYKWQSLKDNAKLRKCVCLLSFEQYVDLAIEANITLDQIGRLRDCYHMSRIKDIGDYVIGNCRFIPHLDNIKEKKENGGHDSMITKLTGRTKDTHEYLKNMGDKQIGKTKENSSSRAAQSAKMKGRTKETHEGYSRISEARKGLTKSNSAGVATQADKISKSFILTSPEGVVFVGRNLTEFCKTHNIGRSSLRTLCSGKSESFKGWTGSYIEREVI